MRKRKQSLRGRRRSSTNPGSPTSPTFTHPLERSASSSSRASGGRPVDADVTRPCLMRRLRSLDGEYFSNGSVVTNGVAVDERQANPLSEEDELEVIVHEVNRSAFVECMSANAFFSDDNTVRSLQSIRWPVLLSSMVSIWQTSGGRIICGLQIQSI